MDDAEVGTRVEDRAADGLGITAECACAYGDRRV